MKNTYVVLALWFLLQAMNGCAPSIKVSSDYDRAADFSSYKTYSIIDIVAKKEVNQLNGPRIMNAIRDNMQKKGYIEKDTTEADLLVNAMTIMKEKRAVTANSNYYGYGGYYRPYGAWGGGSVTFDTHEYVDGSLIIDVVNNKTQKLLWQGVGNAEIDQMPKNPDQFISHAVTKIMNGFPPKGK